MGWKLKSTITECGILPFFLFFFVWALDINHHISIHMYIRLFLFYAYTTLRGNTQTFIDKYKRQCYVWNELSFYYFHIHTHDFWLLFFIFYFLFASYDFSSACLTYYLVFFKKFLSVISTKALILYAYPFQCSVPCCYCVNALIGWWMVGCQWICHSSAIIRSAE